MLERSLETRGVAVRGRAGYSAGVTLVELMVTVAVLAVVAAIAFPSFRGVLHSNRVATATNEVVASFALARSEAVRSSQGAGICASTNGSACDGTWADGLMVWADQNGDGQFTAGETVLRFVAFAEGFDVDGPAQPFAFDGRGRRAGNSDALALQPTDCAGGSYRRQITLSTTGQLRTTKGDCE